MARQHTQARDPGPAGSSGEEDSGGLPWTAILSVLDPDGTRTSHPFRHPRMMVGRKEHNDLSLADQAISSEHCEFINEGGWLVARDLGSANGTFVNGKRISEARLRDGDEVKVGGTRIAVQLQGKVGPVRRRRSTIARTALFALPVLLLLAGGAAVLAVRQRSGEAFAKAREKYAAAVRDLLQRDACATLDGAALGDLEARIGSRSVALQMSNGAVALTPPDRKNDLELLALYREKLLLYDKAFAALTELQQSQRDGLEHVSRLGARFKDPKDRKVAFWAEGQLNERVTSGDKFLQGLRGVSAETGRFSDLVEAVAVRNEAASAAPLARFQFATDVRQILRDCHDENARTQSGSLAALNALDDEE